MFRKLITNRYLLWSLLSIPFFYYTYQLFFGDLGAQPAEKINETMGTVAMRLLIFSGLIGAVTSLMKTSHWVIRILLLRRRDIGVATFLYAALHALFFYVKEGGFREGVHEILNARYLMFGSLAFGGLIILGLTSNDYSQRKLGYKKWKKLHRLTYYVTGLAAIHFVMIEKADLRWAVIYFVPLFVLQLIRVMKIFT